MLALTGFLLLAGFHFGEADTQELPLPEGVRYMLTISRALVVILLPLLVWPELTWPNVAMLLGTELPSAPLWLPSLIAPLLAPCCAQLASPIKILKNPKSQLPARPLT